MSKSPRSPEGCSDLMPVDVLKSFSSAKAGNEEAALTALPTARQNPQSNFLYQKRQHAVGGECACLPAFVYFPDGDSIFHHSRYLGDF